MENHLIPAESPNLAPVMESYQAGFADAQDGEDFVRGTLDGDIALPRAPVRDPVVMQWEELTEPRLSPTHDVVGRAVASFFTRDGGFVYLTQEMIAEQVRLSRQVVNRCMRDLVAVGRFEQKDFTSSQGKRGFAYRLTGEDTGWQPESLGMDGRVTIKVFEDKVRIRELEQALIQVAGRLGDRSSLPDSVLKVLDSIDASQVKESSSYLRRREELDSGSHGALSSFLLDNALQGDSKAAREVATDSQLISIAIHQERTGFSDDDVLASWEKIQSHGVAPGGLDDGQLSKYQAHRLIRWFMRQPDAPQPEIERPTIAEPTCICDELAPAPVEEISAEAQESWNEVLFRLEQELPRQTFDTWLKGSRGIRVDGSDLVVQVASVFTLAWLEQRMYQSILRAVRSVWNAQGDVRFVTGGPLTCPVHGDCGGGGNEDS